MTSVILFVLGAVVGSFLNVVSLRWDRPRSGGALSNFGGRSACPSCGRRLRWWELVPIVSFFVLKARCQGCQAKISWQYPIIEIWTGLIFTTVPYIFIPVFCIYIVITIYDLRHKIIPDELVYLAILLSLFIPLFFISYSILDWLAGPVLFVFFGLIWLLSKGYAMGFGDAKLGLSVGLLLGATQGFSAIILAFWIGALGSLAYLVWDKAWDKAGLPAGEAGFPKASQKLTMKSEIPFAPFIVVGAWMSLVFGLNLFYVTLF